MKLLILTLSLILPISLYSQTNSDSIKISEIKNEIHYLSIKLDSALVKQDKIINVEKPWIEKNGSWIAAIIIGILTVLTNILINYHQRKSSTSTANLQIENSKDIALRQIKSSTIVAFRQKWIDSLRDCISEYISLSTYLYLKIYIREDANEEQMVESFKELALVHEKVKLYLNPNEEKHQKIIECMRIIRNYLYHDEHEVGDREKILEETKKLTDITKEVLKEEWQRIKTESL